MLSVVEQQIVFNEMREGIDRELRHTGFEEFFITHGMDPSVGRLVVARNFEYSSPESAQNPLAQRMATHHEVGIVIEEPFRTSYGGLLVSHALHGDAQEPVAAGLELEYIQLVTINAAVHRLFFAKSPELLRYLTKSLMKIDPAGD